MKRDSYAVLTLGTADLQVVGVGVVVGVVDAVAP